MLLLRSERSGSGPRFEARSWKRRTIRGSVVLSNENRGSGNHDEDCDCDESASAERVCEFDDVEQEDDEEETGCFRTLLTLLVVVRKRDRNILAI